MNVLIVEDELLIAELIQTVLQEMGISCLLAHSADQAERVLAEHEVDALTLDLGMPGRSGLDWLETVASFDAPLARKTLIITGMPLRPGVVERVTRCGAGILAKPFTVDALHDAVRSQLGPLGSDSRPRD
jgi:two-component system response regulator TctD